MQILAAMWRFGVYKRRVVGDAAFRSGREAGAAAAGAAATRCAGIERRGNAFAAGRGAVAVGSLVAGAVDELGNAYKSANAADKKKHNLKWQTS